MTKKYCVKCGYDYYVSRFCKVADEDYLCPHCRTEIKNAHGTKTEGKRLGKRQ